MLDLAFVRQNLSTVEDKLRSRGANPEQLLGNFREIETRRRALTHELELALARRNELSKKIGRLMGAEKKGSITADQKSELESLSAEVLKLKEGIPALEEQSKAADKQLYDILATIPNLPHESVPVGKDETANVEVKRWGAPPVMDFTPKPHWELGEQLGILDLERASKITGARFALYWDMGAKLERALMNFMLDLHTREHGYTEVLPPYLVNSESMYGTGQLPKFEQDLFKVPQGERDLWLIPTAEVPVTNIFRDETLEASRLPVSLTAYTPCWRSEAGSYGKDVRGIIRQHQFQKVELVKFSKPEESYDEHEKLTRAAEEVLERLGLHYRRMLLCSGDMGFSSAKTYDLEVWLPGQGLFREISSCSNFESFQARRANIRYRTEGRKGTELVHTLNGSGLAIGRTWVAIVENYQQKDGSVLIPEALRPYIGAEKIETRKM
ncbi:MAG TPA: serine--tRNA ligase [Candidatus Saccharimonadales bacterium]|nr:serine--tRNA ligase [Candidatus Saccharimonadales bacterium]